jgi:urease accessory protein
MLHCLNICEVQILSRSSSLATSIFSTFKPRSLFFSFTSLTTLFITAILVVPPALAHHPLGGRLPGNGFEGFLSGLAHPIIGLDHLAFIVAVGLLATLKRQGVLMPIAFVVTAMIGTGLHLMQFSLPAAEFFIAASVLLFGSLLAVKQSVNVWGVVGLAAIAGLFHGYAYGEAVFGAEMSPLIAYLTGFTVIQLIVAMIAFWVGRTALKRAAEPALSLRFAGFIICGIGLTAFSTLVLETVFPG